MKLSHLQALAAASAILMSFGITNLALGGALPPFEPYDGNELSVTEQIVGGGVEFTINNPTGSGLSINGLMVGIPNQTPIADVDVLNTQWGGGEISSEVERADFLDDLELFYGLGSTALDSLFAGFFDDQDGQDTILTFFEFFGCCFVPEGNSLDGFFGLDQVPSSESFLFDVSGETVPVETVPEPGMLALFGIGVIGIGLAVRRRRAA